MNCKTSILLKFFFLFFMSFGFVKNGISQTDRNGKIVAFHPSVGNSITLDEKKEFSLFTEYNDSLFESAQLFKYSVDTTYAVLFKTTNEKSFEKQISIKELDAIYASIEKRRPATTNTTVDDYFEKKPTKEEIEEQKKANRKESAEMIAEISFQVIYTILIILANNWN